MTASSRIVRREILKVVDNQLQSGEPAETRETLDRLVAAGYSPTEARRLIGCAVAVEIWCILHNGRPHDEARYLANLRRLPEDPVE